MFRNLIVLAVAALGIPAAAAAQAPGAQPADPAADFTALTARLEKAALNDDTQGVKDARIACMRLLAAAPSGPKAAIVRYTIAYAGWRLAFSPRIPAAEQIGLLADAEEQLGQVIKLDAAFADAHGLLSSVYGAQISKNTDLGMTLGMAAGEALGRALSREPNNPRLVMMQGLNLLHTPAEYGGDVKQAETALRRSVQLFDKEPASKAWPSWGRFDAHLWLAQLLAERGDAAGARAEYTAALALAPDSARVKGMLAHVK